MRISKRVKSLQDEINEDYLKTAARQPDYSYNDQEETTQPHMRPPPSGTYYHDREDETHGFGDTRESGKIAKDIEDHPTPPGICEVIIGGRPVDLHMFEDYMVWRISPYQMRTILRYRTARIMEEIKNYSSSPKAKLGSNFFILLVIIIIMLMVGVAIFMFMPQITEMFKGFM